MKKGVYDGREIETVSIHKYLGALITSRLCWSSPKNNRASQAKTACYSIYRSKRKFGYFSPRDYFKLFDSIAKIILCFASDVWSYE